MCKKATEGPRCAGHTRPGAAAALAQVRTYGLASLTDTQISDLVAYASTPKGHRVLQRLNAIVTADGENENGFLLDHALERGAQIAEADRDLLRIRREQEDTPESLLLHGDGPLQEQVRELAGDFDYAQQHSLAHGVYEDAYDYIDRGKMFETKYPDQQERLDFITKNYLLVANAYERGQSDPLTPISDEEWRQMVDMELDRLRETGKSADLITAYESSKGHTPRNLAEARALLSLPRRAAGANVGMDVESRLIAGLQDVDVDVARRELDRVRAEYLATDPSQRPTVPEDHAAAFDQSYFGNQVTARVMMPPTDPATQYAIYALTNEPERLSEYRTPREYVVFDTETTGFAEDSAILQVAAIAYSPDGEEIERYVTYIHPGYQPDGSVFTGGPAAVDTHHITAETLQGAPTVDTVAPELHRVLAGRTLVAHNAQFDFLKVRRMLRNQGMPDLYDAPVVDTVRVARYNQPRPAGVRAKDFSYRLTSVCERAGIPIDPDRAHEALYDVEMCANAYRALHFLTPAKSAVGEDAA